MSLRDRLANAFASVYLSVMVIYVLRSKYRAWRGPKYPYRDGDFWILGPQIFTDTTGEVISWRGENYVSQERVAHAAHIK